MIARVIIDLMIMMVRIEVIVKHVESALLLRRQISPMLCMTKAMELDPDLDIRMRSC